MMELGLREWLLVFGALIVVAVLSHGFWEMRRRSRSQIKLQVGKGFEVNAFPDDDTCGGELVGRARVLDLPDADESGAVPMLMDPLDVHTSRGGAEAGFSAISDDDHPPAQHADPAPASSREQAPGRPPEDAPVIVLYVLGREGKRFGGDEILQVLLACGLQYGDMQVFHRHAGVRGDGGLQFSVANAVEPGVFDLDRMNELATPGLSFFMEMRPGMNVEQSYEYLYETANYTANKLGGQLCDERRQPLERETVERHRALAQDYMRRQAATV